MEKIVEQGMLYDFYGELLTPHQRKIYEDVVFNDMSLSEIAEEQGISRQGVHDTLARAEQLLASYETALGCIARDRQIEQGLAVIERCAHTLQHIAGAQDCAAQILQAVQTIKE